MTVDAHPLLSRLLRKVGVTPAEVPSAETWRALLALISRTYHEADQDRYTLERSIDISSREMQGLYQDLKRRTDTELEERRKQVEESYAVLRATLESASEGIVVVDANRGVVAVNRRYGEMMRISAELLSSRDHRAVIAESMKMMSDPTAARARIEEIHATRDVVHDELTLKDARILDRYSAPVTRADGTHAGRVTFFRDVTAERTANKELRAAWTAAEGASTAKSMFVANMSHELRTPLNAVIGLADLLLLESGDPITRRQREYLEGVVQSGRHLLALVNNVLDLAKIEAGKHDLELDVVEVQDAIEEALTGLVPLAHHRGVSVSLQVRRSVRAVRADRLRFRQILYNLMTNALKFTDRGGTVTLTARDEGDGVTLTVEDTGIGIAETDMPRLFQPFEQLDQPSGDRPTGTGLGLALTKRLVDMHGGSIEVESDVGVGTRFTVRMPAV
ncbi:MAG: PAS-domain containing protein [Deltaproteobacteria bacterium]|nr:PAS-domain containing protein [Deltaproteobacteria bacterium]